MPLLISDEGREQILKMLDDLQREICGPPKKKRLPEGFIRKQKEDNEKEQLIFRGILISDLDEDSLFAAVRYLGRHRMDEMEENLKCLKDAGDFMHICRKLK